MIVQERKLSKSLFFPNVKLFMFFSDYNKTVILSRCINFFISSPSVVSWSGFRNMSEICSIKYNSWFTRREKIFFMLKVTNIWCEHCKLKGLRKRLGSSGKHQQFIENIDDTRLFKRNTIFSITWLRHLICSWN
jgi:hypothetical protein